MEGDDRRGGSDALECSQGSARTAENVCCLPHLYIHRIERVLITPENDACTVLRLTLFLNKGPLRARQDGAARCMLSETTRTRDTLFLN